MTILKLSNNWAFISFGFECQSLHYMHLLEGLLKYITISIPSRQGHRHGSPTTHDRRRLPIHRSITVGLTAHIIDAIKSPSKPLGIPLPAYMNITVGSPIKQGHHCRVSKHTCSSPWGTSAHMGIAVYLPAHIIIIMASSSKWGFNIIAMRSH